MKYYTQYRPGEPCPRNEAVLCPDRSKCSRCGWNPKVSDQRLAAVIEELKKKRRAAHGKY